MLDTRLVGRDQQAARRDDVATIESRERSLLGAAQEGGCTASWLSRGARGTRWQMLGQQVMFAPQTPPGKPTTNADSWDGYRASARPCVRHGRGAEDRQLRRA